MKTTRDLIVHAKPFIKGNVLDFGAGNAKYRDLILKSAKEYLTYDKFGSSTTNIRGESETIKGDFFQTVISTQVLEHVSRPWLVAKEIYRITKSGGGMLLFLPRS